MGYALLASSLNPRNLGTVSGNPRHLTHAVQAVRDQPCSSVLHRYMLRVVGMLLTVFWADSRCIDFETEQSQILAAT
jgi:hypothetical protein